MLTSLLLQLKLLDSAQLPASLGRAGQALLLRLLDERDATLLGQVRVALEGARRSG